MAFPTTDGLIFVEDQEIIYCESDSNYTTIYLTNKRKSIISRTLGDIEGMLSKDIFCRIHHSYLINIKHLHRYIKGNGGYVELSEENFVKVSSRKKQEFLDRFN